MKQKMWDGRFEESSSELLEEFNASIFFDNKLFKEDIKGSIAHAKMLSSVGIITDEEYEAIKKGLHQVLGEIESGEFKFDISQEDIHMAVEGRLTEIIGEAGKKLHTARSRNDQVATDFRLYCQNQNQNLRALIKNLISAIVSIAKENTSTLVPGMTHLQHAQPISFAFHMLAYAAMFKRDYERLESSFERNNYSPLGSAALAGTPHPIDRDMTARELGFFAPTINAMDSTSDRDFALEMLFNISVLFTHISRLSEELILWSSYEFKWITMSDKFSTGSSIMPQKKNPDVAELLRGKTGRVYGNLMGLLTVMKGLPLAYNKDMQEDKEGVFDSVETASASLVILTEMLKSMKIEKENMLRACEIGHLTATDLADYLVKKGVPFRETHHISGRAVALAEKKGVDLSKLSLEELKGIDNRIDEGALEVLKHINSMNARRSYGGTSEESVRAQIAYFEEFLRS
ncbi:MAG: argininosuccinate lyase [Campylobacteraceae bacterium]|jgi:argininosuccinate lyase|nr:argininosuccinate lyase [Campylobacteraceae bacterium]